MLDERGRRMVRAAQDILGEPDGMINEDTMMEIRVKNNARNPLTDVVTSLPRYCPPGKPPKMSLLGLEGSCMPNRCVPHDGEMFRGSGRIPQDREVVRRNCLPTDSQLFDHKRIEAYGEPQRVRGMGNRPATPRGPRGPRVGRSRRN